MISKNIFRLEERAQVQNFQKDSINSYSGWVALLISLLLVDRGGHYSHFL